MAKEKLLSLVALSTIAAALASCRDRRTSVKSADRTLPVAEVPMQLGKGYDFQPSAALQKQKSVICIDVSTKSDANNSNGGTPKTPPAGGMNLALTRKDPVKRLNFDEMHPDIRLAIWKTLDTRSSPNGIQPMQGNAALAYQELTGFPRGRVNYQGGPIMALTEGKNCDPLSRDCFVYQVDLEVDQLKYNIRGRVAAKAYGLLRATAEAERSVNDEEKLLGLFFEAQIINNGYVLEKPYFKFETESKVRKIYADTPGDSSAKAQAAAKYIFENCGTHYVSQVLNGAEALVTAAYKKKDYSRTNRGSADVNYARVVQGNVNAMSEILNKYDSTFLGVQYTYGSSAEVAKPRANLDEPTQHPETAPITGSTANPNELSRAEAVVAKFSSSFVEPMVHVLSPFQNINFRDSAQFSEDAFAYRERLKGKRSETYLKKLSEEHEKLADLDEERTLIGAALNGLVYAAVDQALEKKNQELAVEVVYNLLTKPNTDKLEQMTLDDVKNLCQQRFGRGYHLIKLKDTENVEFQGDIRMMQADNLNGKYFWVDTTGSSLPACDNGKAHAKSLSPNGDIKCLTTTMQVGYGICVTEK